MAADCESFLHLCQGASSPEKHRSFGLTALCGDGTDFLDYGICPIRPNMLYLAIQLTQQNGLRRGVYPKAADRDVTASFKRQPFLSF